MAQKYHIIPEFPNYAISTDSAVIDRKTETRLTEYPLSGFAYVIVDGLKMPIPILYVWTFVGRGNFRITTDKTGYTYYPPMDIIQISDDEYFLGDKDARPEEMEYFKRIPRFSQYLISPTGLIYNKERYKFLHRTYNHHNYLVATLTDDNGFRSPRKIHRLVYAAFIGPISDGMTIDHIDNVRWHNDPRNLRALHRADNTLRAYSSNGSYTDISWSRPILERICKGISEGKGAPDIARSINFDANRYDIKSLNDLIFNIRIGKIYQDIMLQYVDSLDDIPYNEESTEPTKYNRTSIIYSKPPEEKTDFNFRKKQYRLTPRDVVNIKQALTNGEKVSDIAKRYNVNEGPIYAIASGTNWKTIQ